MSLAFLLAGEKILGGAKQVSSFLGGLGNFFGGGRSKASKDYDAAIQADWVNRGLPGLHPYGWLPSMGNPAEYMPTRNPTTTAMGLTDLGGGPPPVPPGWGGGGGTPPIVQQPEDSNTHRRTGVIWDGPWGPVSMGTESDKHYYRTDPSAEGSPMPGTGMQMWGGCPPGYHLNKGDYWVDDPNGGPQAFKVHKGSRCVKNRHRNPLNPKALSSALRRVVTAKRAVKFLDKVHIGGSGVRTRYLPASSGHKSGCGCVVCKRR